MTEMKMMMKMWDKDIAVNGKEGIRYNILKRTYTEIEAFTYQRKIIKGEFICITVYHTRKGHAVHYYFDKNTEEFICIGE